MEYPDQWSILRSKKAVHFTKPNKTVENPTNLSGLPTSRSPFPHQLETVHLWTAAHSDRPTTETETPKPRVVVEAGQLLHISAPSSSCCER